MQDKKQVVLGAVAGLVALGLATGSPSAFAAQAKKDSDKEEWVYVPNGTCDKLVGASVYKPAKK